MEITKEQIFEHLRHNLKRLRKGKYSQEKLAEKIGKSHSFVRQIENKQSFASIETLCQLANVLRCEVSDLLENPEKKSSMPDSVKDLSMVIASQQVEINTLKASLEAVKLTKDESAILEAYRNAGPYQKIAIEKMSGFGFKESADIVELKPASEKIEKEKSQA